MGRASILSLATMHVQFVSLLSKISLPWPNQWKSILSVLEVLNLDPRALFGLQEWPVVDFRVLFIFVANFLPILITFLILVLFNPLYVVAWYAMTVFSFVAVVAGLWMLLVEELKVGIWIAAGGGFAFLVCIVIGGISYCMNQLDDDETDVTKHGIKKRQMALQFQWKRTFKFFLLTAGFFFGASVLTGMFFDFPFSNRENDSLYTLGYAMYVLAGFSFVLLVLTSCDWGRKKLLNTKEFLQANLLMVMLVLIGATYVPIITYCVNNFMCTTYSCPAGTRFNPFAPRESGSFTKSQDLFCDPCTFLDDRCGAHNGTSGFPATLMCPSFKSVRIWSSPEISCSDASQIFFTISSLLVLPSYLIFIPILYVLVVSKLTTHILDGEKVKLIPHTAEENVEFLPPIEQYKRKVYAVEPAAASLYQPFVLPHRYFIVWLLMFRLLIVIVTEVITPFNTEVSVYLLLASHVFGVGIIIYMKPFISLAEHWLTVALEGCSVLNGIYAILIMKEVKGMPGWISYVLLGLNVVVPFFAFVFTTKFVRTSSSKAEKHIRKMKKKHSKMQLKRLQRGTVHLDDVLDPMLAQEMQPNRIAGIDIPKGVQMTEREMQQVLDNNEKTTRDLNDYTASIITKCFMLIGFILIIALGVSALGYVRQDLSRFREGSTSLRRTDTYVLGGYTNWDNFTENCCCIESQNPPVGGNVTERWICENGVTVDRVRLDGTLKDNGLPLRGLCETKFNLGCVAYVNDSLTSLFCPKYNLLIQKDVTETARDRYW